MVLVSCGRILSAEGRGIFLVREAGRASARLVKLADMMSWEFFGTEAEMRRRRERFDAKQVAAQHVTVAPHRAKPGEEE